jgi:hypothetical protein
MSVVVKYINAPARDADPITANFQDWVATLSAADQQAVQVAQRKFNLARAVAEGLGKLHVTYNPDMTFTWATSADADAGFVVPEWEAIQARYCAENNVTITAMRT